MNITDDLLVSVYAQFRNELAKQPPFGKYADFNWYVLPDSSNILWFVYAEILQECSRSIANIINQLGENSRRLLVWDSVLKNFEDETRIELLFEFVDQTALVALTQPYAIKSRFYFAVSHLSHQANRTKLGQSWSDDLPLDRDIGAKTARKYANQWKSFEALDLSLQSIYPNRHKFVTDDFRDKFTHRVPTQEIMGHTGVVTRRIGADGKSKVYDIGYRPPADLKSLAEELKEEFVSCIEAYDNYKKLVREQIDEIVNYT